MGRHESVESRLNEFKALLEIRSGAEADQLLAHLNKLGIDKENAAAELRVRTERRAGKLLATLIRRGGDRRSNAHVEALKLSDTGIDRNKSSRWQTLAALSDDVFEDYIRTAKQAGRLISTNGLVRLARHGDRSHPSRADAPDP